MNHLQYAFDRQNQFWKYLVTFVVSFFVVGVIGSIPLIVIATIKAIQNGDINSISADFLGNLGNLGISPNTALVLMMLPLVLGFFSLIPMFKWLHRRTLKGMINGTTRIRWNKFFSGAAVWAVLSAVYLLADYLLNATNYVLQFNISTFIPLVVISLLMIPFQTSFEELFFRGYLVQGVASWTKNKWCVILIPSILFGLMHSFNPEVEKFGFWITMPQYILYGVLFGLVCVLDDGIELAMGAHAANNIFLSLFVTHASSTLQTDAVFSLLSVNPLKELVVLIIMGILFLVFLSWKYGWNYSLLNKKITENRIESNPIDITHQVN